MDKMIISWDDYQAMVERMADYYRPKHLQAIVGLSRGGLTLGVSLSHQLGVPLYPLVWQTRDMRKEQDVMTLLKLEQEIDIRRAIFVDDICDSGTTIDQINSIVDNIRWATLINKIPGRVDYSCQEVDGEEWIVFPWEKP